MLVQYLLCVCAALASFTVTSAPQEDLVVDLPGLSFKPNFKHYSGYLNGSDPTNRLHYWFVESSSDPSRDPLVLWMNGGPGCSSLLGLLTEHGPFQVKEDAKTVVPNPFSWNQVANVIYLEAPAGVGFSYSTIHHYNTGDNETAVNNYAALKDFMKKFPEFKGRDFYITGESYGGIYVPTLSSLVMDDPSFNLKGFAVGNGLSDYKMNDNSLIYFVYYHGLIGDQQWNHILKSCCPSSGTARCDFQANQSKQCLLALIDIQKLVWGSGLNVYNVYSECAGGVKDLTLDWDASRGKYVSSNPGWPFMFLQDTSVARKYQMRQSLPAGSVHDSPPCVGDLQVITYLNTQAVREALHIPKGVFKWEMCSDKVNYRKEYQTMAPQYMKAIQKKLRILVYNGDVDMACNFLGDEWFVDSLHQGNPQRRHPWYYTAADGTKQNAGFVKVYDNLSLVTVRGSGHMVPSDRPRPALEMFINFIQNKPFKMEL